MAHYCVSCGSRLETRLFEGRALEACPNDDFVLWRDPKVASAVVVETDGGVLLGRRPLDPAYGFWGLPGGFGNDHEHPAGSTPPSTTSANHPPLPLTPLSPAHHRSPTE